jgi:PKD repeat protein
VAVVDRISSSDEGYQSGDLSIYPQALDDKDTLYQATNNTITTLKQTLTYASNTIIVEDASKFPATGTLRIGPPPGQQGQYEVVYYQKRTDSTFQELKRGFSGSRRNVWVIGSHVTNAVEADHHNTIKDAIINIETNLGLETDPDSESLNGILKAQEVRFLAPKAIFRSFPLKGPPPLTVRFQNFSTGHVVRTLWDFGDGSTSLDTSPIHTYEQEGKYTVKLNVITATGAQGVVTKLNYIEVNKDETIPFFYVESVADPYSFETAATRTSNGNPTDAKEFVFVDQSDGDIVQRNWIFGDGNKFVQDDPDIHTVSHIYQQPGTYSVSLLIIFSSQRLKTVGLSDPLIVL